LLDAAAAAAVGVISVAVSRVICYGATLAATTDCYASLEMTQQLLVLAKRSETLRSLNTDQKLRKNVVLVLNEKPSGTMSCYDGELPTRTERPSASVDSSSA